MKTIYLSTTVLFCALVGSGCGKKEQAAPPQAANSPYGQPGPYGQPPSGQAPYGQPTQAGQAYGQPPPAQPAPYGQTPSSGQTQLAPGQVAPIGSVFGDPATLQNILAGALSGGAAALGAATGGELGPIEQGIKAQASTQAKGMRSEGQLMSAHLQPDGHASGSLTLQPGSCYTVIGFGGIGVLDYQLSVVTAPPVPPQVLAQSPAGGVAPIIGPNEQCIRSPYPLPLVVNVDMHALRGQGLVGAQVYKK